MRAYRMGRKPMGPWINMTPPIRGGIYRLPGTPNLDPEDLDDAVGSVGEALTSTLPHLDEAIDLDPLDAVRRRVTPSGPLGKRLSSSPARSTITNTDSGYGGDGDSDGRSSVGSEAGEKPDARFTVRPGRMCPTAYTDSLIQDNVDKDLRDYPSLDPIVQQDIVQRYRQLHQQVRDEGLYSCRYTEYGKEMVRYTTLFIVFATALHYGWYLTSAVFLGLFWVRLVLAPSFDSC